MITKQAVEVLPLGSHEASEIYRQNLMSSSVHCGLRLACLLIFSFAQQLHAQSSTVKPTTSTEGGSSRNGAALHAGGSAWSTGSPIPLTLGSREVCVAGKVFVDCNRNAVQDNDEPGIAGVRLYMEDGTNVTTDEHGRYSLCGIRSISHVMKVDASTMPAGSVMGITSNANLGDGSSLMMNPRLGELTRADFTESSCQPQILEQIARHANHGSKNAPAAQGNKGQWAVTFDSKEQERRRPAICATKPDESICKF